MQHASFFEPDGVRYRPPFVPVAVPPKRENDDVSLHRANHLLAALPFADFVRWLPQFESVELPYGRVLCDSNQMLSYVYFPTTSIVSLIYQLESGATSEIASVGNEGVVGVSPFMGGSSMPCKATVDVSGRGFPVCARTMLDAFQRIREVMRPMLLYIQALAAQIAQTAVCNRHRSLDQRLCRLLLRTLDRQPSGEFALTQERIAGMLGVRREGVTEAALSIQNAGLIRYGRGHISVLDRAGLERRACECYSVVRKEFRRLFSLLHAL